MYIKKKKKKKKKNKKIKKKKGEKDNTRSIVVYDDSLQQFYWKIDASDKSGDYWLNGFVRQRKN